MLLLHAAWGTWSAKEHLDLPELLRYFSWRGIEHLLLARLATSLTKDHT